MLKKVSLLMISAVMLAGAQNRCFRYDSDSFVVDKSVEGKGVVKRTKPESLKIYFLGDRSETRPITVEYTLDGKKNYNKYIFCMKQENGLEWCGVECDGGGFYRDGNYAIKIENMALYRDEPETENGVDITIRQKDANSFVKGVEFQCPADIPKANIVDEKYYHDMPEGLNVCYEYKDDSKYYGCFRSTKKCRELHLQHFGRYPSRIESAKALKRCMDSRPRRDYIDNRNGLYVCYDYKDRDGYYSGCFRSLKPCSRIHKERFGKYPDKAESAKALRRCVESSPRQR